MKNIIKPGIVLLIISVIAAAILGYVNAITAKPIEEADANTKMEKMKEVYNTEEWGEEVIVSDKKYDKITSITSYTPTKDGSAYAFSVETKGFASGLKLMIGIDKDSKITGLAVVDCSNETPGLGANAKNESFYGQFADKKGKLSVVKPGLGEPKDTEIVALTGATITSNAVVEATNCVTKYFEENLKDGGVK